VRRRHAKHVDDHVLELELERDRIPVLVNDFAPKTCS